MKDTSDKLKPCPFCGGTDLHLIDTDTQYLICYDCLSWFTQAEAVCEEDLIEAWNRRPELT